jgi:hypothetical protein
MMFTKTLVVINAVLMGLFAFSFSHGPYSSFEQELWYRWASVSFFVAGAVLPAGLMFMRPPIARRISAGLNLWLALIFFAFIPYLMSSGGGV